MKVLNNRINLASFLHKVSISPETIILLDYDGTLAPFKKKRSKAVPYRGIKEILTKLIDLNNCKIIIVSGRSVSDIRLLLDLEKYPEIWGCHGAEKITEDGNLLTTELSRQTIKGLKEAKEAVIKKGLWKRCEQKYSSLALHWRELSSSKIYNLKKRVVSMWENIIRKNDLTISEFDGGIEIRPENITKGNVVDSILNQYREGIPVIYVGDDFTDEDAFRALKGKGLSVLVKPRYRSTEADIWLKPPGELLDFLNELAGALETNYE